MKELNLHTPAPAPDRLRRQWLAAIGASLGLSWAGLTHAQPSDGRSASSLLLNTGLSGPVAFFLLAQDKGYLRDEGLDVQFSGGPGAAAMVPMVRDGAFEFGYGDISALIERIARGQPGAGPVAVYPTFIGAKP